MLKQFLRSDLINPGMWLFAAIMLLVGPVIMLRNALFGKPADPTAHFFPDLPWGDDEDSA